ncbi:MAG: helix-turn-helix domain-containing protein [Fusobacteriaceae bacterium]|jgi:excisionase family DNA binding protein|nr:helix-turn-helix domain-containing protein [Fusobacteriaceae bacterium]
MSNNEIIKKEEKPQIQFITIPLELTVYTVKEAAQLLKCSQNRIYELVSIGEIKALNIGKKVIRAAEIKRFLDRQEAN